MKIRCCSKIGIYSISISGVDGSGKSTVVLFLSKYLHRKSKVKIIWFRWRALALYALYLYSKLRGLYAKVYAPWIKHWFCIHVFHADTVTKRLYPYLLFIDLTLFYLLYRLMLFVGGIKVMIFDRFYLDALVDTIYACRHVNRTFLRLFIAMQKKTFKALVLDVDADTAVVRKKDIISRNEIEFKRRAYLILAKHLGIPVVDARKDLSYVLSDARKALQMNC